MDVGTPSILSMFLSLVHSYTSPNVLGQVMRESPHGVSSRSQRLQGIRANGMCFVVCEAEVCS